MGDDPSIAPPTEEIIPTTMVTGPGGPAYMRGTLRDYLRPRQPATSMHLYLMNPRNFGDTVLHVFVNSSDASFLITQLPVDTIDLIFAGSMFLSVKINPFLLRSDHNSFDNLGPEGLWVDSTLYIVAVADSVPRPNMPQSGLLGYGNSIALHFKAGIGENQARTIASSFSYSNVQVFRDSIQGLILDLIYPSFTNSIISQRLLYFNWRIECRGGPLLAQIDPRGLLQVRNGVAVPVFR